MSRFIRGKRWYTRLVHNEAKRALLDDHPLSTLDRSLVVCLCHTKFGSWNGESYRLFTHFSSYLDFFPYYNSFTVEERSFYETVFGQFAQKPHFDIDIGAEAMSAYSEEPSVIGDKLMEALITGCCQVLADREVAVDIARDICIYDSHGTKKRSYHLVLGTMCHSDHQEARAFYQEVIARVYLITNGKYLEFIDMGVYSKVQQFRIVGCQKEGTGRIKRFQEVFEYQGQQYEHIYPEPINSNEHKKLVILSQSLLSFTSGCRMLPSFAPAPTPCVYPTQTINDVQVGEVIALFQAQMDTSPFSIREVKDNSIMLKRERPSRCPTCDRVHEHENPKLVVNSNRVYWYCRRAIGGYLLGEITTAAQIVDEVQTEEREPKVINEDLMLGDVDYSSLIEQGCEAKAEAKCEVKVEEKVVTEPIITSDRSIASDIETAFKPQPPPMVNKIKKTSPVQKALSPVGICAPLDNINQTKIANHMRSKYGNGPWNTGIKKK